MINAELLITEIEKRPSLWNKSAEGYKDENYRQDCWDEVCKELNEGFEGKSKEEKQSIKNNVTSKWKDLCKRYLRQRRKHDKSSEGESLIGNWDKLSFLLKEYSSESSEDETEENEIRKLSCPRGCLKEKQNLKAPTTPPSKKRKLTDMLENMKENISENPVEKRSPMDDNEAFFLSLLPAVQSLDEEQKINFRIQVLQAFANVKRPRGNFSHQNGPQLLPPMVPPPPPFNGNNSFEMHEPQLQYSGDYHTESPRSNGSHRMLSPTDEPVASPIHAVLSGNSELTRRGSLDSEESLNFFALNY